MSSWSGWPNINTFLSIAWGWPSEVVDSSISIASNVVLGGNPPFSPVDFLSFYPNFGGNPLIFQGQITAGSPVVASMQDTAGLLPGMIVCPFIPLNGNLLPGAFPSGTAILSVDSNNQITLTQNASVNGGQVSVYNQPFVPIFVLVAYINLATASLSSKRWQQMWPIAMCWYIAHFCTLYLRSCGNIATSAGQLATQGLARGITISKAAGGVSMGIQPSTAGSGLEGWGHFTETTYGVAFATQARIVGGGPLFLW